MAKKDRLDVIVTVYRKFRSAVDALAALQEDQLDARLVERIDQRVRQFCRELVQAAEDLRAEGGVQPRPGGRPRLALVIEEIKKAYKEELLKRAGTEKVAAVEAVARRFKASKRTIYRALATPDE
jgi:hypothetical protein